MSEIYYEVTLLFRDEQNAVSFFDSLQKHEKEADYELIRLVNLCCGSAIELTHDNYDIEKQQRFRNEIRIFTYTGRNAEYPLQIVEPLKTAGCGIVKISVMYEDTDRWRHRFFVDGKKANKKTYDKAFAEHKFEDRTDELQRLLSTRSFSKAAKIIDDCDLGRIEPDPEFISPLIWERGKYDDIAIKLIDAGLLDEPDSQSNAPWILHVAEMGSARLLAACLERGMDCYATNATGETTTLHAVMFSGDEFSEAKTKLIIDACRDNLNPVTVIGSPLWAGRENMANVVGCRLMHDAGALIIPPAGFYDGLDARTTVREAVKHTDLDTLQENYTAEFYDDVLYLALLYQSFESVKWVDAQEPIDWMAKYGGDGAMGIRDLDAFYSKLPFYELPFSLSDSGPGFDSRLVEHIVESVPASRDTYSKLFVYIAGIKHFPEQVALMTRLKDLGADIDAKFVIDAGPYSTSAVDRSLMKECIDSFE
ncbi:MAG: hypothetical protein QNJ00_16545, partial [Woeseiaceae bacterium]|nr:hypothetical protein [Woeseiaceae bacterium]